MVKRLTNPPDVITSHDVWRAIAEFADTESSGLILADEKVKPMAVVFKAAQLYAEGLDIIDRTKSQN